MTPWEREFLARERLPENYLATARRCFDPLAEQLAERARSRDRALVVGINGAQGSGKSTLCAYLAAALTAGHGVKAVALSLDDFYLTRAEREQLADSVHPLLRTRGVPGTHDVALLRRTIERLRAAQAGDPPLSVPAFDKSSDDRRPAAQWPRCQPPLGVVLLEGWCLGARSVADDALQPPLNELERSEDADGRWRRYCNAALRDVYEPFYAQVDLWVMLEAPGFDAVFGWRSEQEEKLAAAVGGSGPGLMGPAALRRFVAHFERHTRACLEQLPATVDVLYRLDAQRRIIDCRGLEGRR